MTYRVNVPKVDSDDNASLDDLVVDVNAALAVAVDVTVLGDPSAATTDLTGRVVADTDGERIRFVGVDDSEFSIAAISDAAVTGLGLATQVSSSGGFVKRNDVTQFAFDLSNDPLAQSSSYTDLTIDNPQDVDWYRFNLADIAADGSRVVLESDSQLDGLDLALFAEDGITGIGEAAVLELSPDLPDSDSSNNTLETATDLDAIQAIENLGRIRGLSLHEATDEDFYRFSLPNTFSGYELAFFVGEIGNELLDLTDQVIDEANPEVLPDIQTLGRVVGMQLGNLDDVDVFHFTLSDAALETDRIDLVKGSQFDRLRIELLDASDQVLATAEAVGTDTLSVRLVGDDGLGLAAGDYKIRVLRDRDNNAINLLKTSADDPLAMALLVANDTPDGPPAGTVLRSSVDVNGQVIRVNLDGLAGGEYILKVSTTEVPARYELAPRVGPEGQAVIDLAGRQRTTLDLSGLAADTSYLLRVSFSQSGPDDLRPNGGSG